MTIEDDLRRCLLSRAGDIAHRALVDGVDVVVSSGQTPNGEPCTVVMAIGWTAEAARKVGEELVRQVEAEREAARLRSEKN